jgi:ribonuclease HI
MMSHRLFLPKDFNLDADIEPSEAFVPNRRGTYHNVVHPNGGLMSNMIGMYVDGACSGNGEPWAKAGYGVYIGPNSRHNCSGTLPDDELHTSQRAEITAALRALDQIDEIKEHTSINSFIIASDSAYLVNSVTDYIFKWRENGWITSSGKGVANIDLLRDLDDRLDNLQDARISVLFWKVDRSENEDADELAKMAIA